MRHFVIRRDRPRFAPALRRLDLTRLAGALCLSALAIVAACRATANQDDPRAIASVAEDRLPPTPGGVIDIVEIHPFRLKEGYVFDWLRSRPVVSAGLLVVLKVDPRYVMPRDTAEPVLFAGDQTVQRLSQGDRSGFVVGIIPGEIDLAIAPVWFGRPQLPERVTPQIIKAERALAERAGIRPFGPETVERARREPIEAEDLEALLRGRAADLVLKYSPAEKHLAETWRLPSASPKPR